MQLRSLLLCICCISLFACKEKQKSSSAEEKTTPEAATKIEDSSATYFSIRDYFDDQWKTRRGSPYTLLKIQQVNGRTDSALVPLDSVLWFSMRAPFAAADISDKKFLGLYRFDTFNDETTETTHLFYEAASPDLYLTKMDVSADAFTNLVKSVYLETNSVKDGHQVSMKLQYIPDRIFQIQTFEKTAGQAEQNTKLEYRFNY